MRGGAAGVPESRNMFGMMSLVSPGDFYSDWSHQNRQMLDFAISSILLKKSVLGITRFVSALT